MNPFNCIGAASARARSLSERDSMAVSVYATGDGTTFRVCAASAVPHGARVMVEYDRGQCSGK